MKPIADFGVLGGQRFSKCAVCGGVVALPDGEHMDASMRQSGCADVLRADDKVSPCSTMPTPLGPPDAPVACGDMVSARIEL